MNNCKACVIEAAYIANGIIQTRLGHIALAAKEAVHLDYSQAERQKEGELQSFK